MSRGSQSNALIRWEIPEVAETARCPPKADIPEIDFDTSPVSDCLAIQLIGILHFLLCINILPNGKWPWRKSISRSASRPSTRGDLRGLAEIAQGEGAEVVRAAGEASDRIVLEGLRPDPATVRPLSRPSSS